MGVIGTCDFKGFEALAARINREATPAEVDQVMLDIANEAGNRALSQVVELTPVGDYPESGKTGGHLKRNWALTPAMRTGEYIEVTLYNNVFYASFVEYGHRQDVGRFVPALGKRLVKPWVEGRFMLTRSMEHTGRNMEEIIKRHTRRFLERLTGGN